MKVFLDTSVLVACVVDHHPHHQRAFPILERVQAGKDDGVVAGHSLVEMYSTLTRMPAPFRHTPEQALLSVEENIAKHFEVAALSGNEYAAFIRESAFARIQGGSIYDALILKAAVKEHVERIFTFNLRHFQAVAPQTVIALLATP
jgi:toxin FitB